MEDNLNFSIMEDDGNLQQMKENLYIFANGRHAPSPIRDDAFPNKKEGWLSPCKIVMNILKDNFGNFD